MEPPIKPSDSDCCNSGCNPCILDVYEQQLQKYYKSIESWKFELQPNTNCMSSTSFTVFRLMKRIKHTEGTYLFRFEYCGVRNGNNFMKLLYKPGQHFMLKAQTNNCNGKAVTITRAYTPIPLSLESDLNDLSFTVLIKLLENGKMSNYLKFLELNSETLWRGPYGDFTINYDSKYIVCIAQGTGIAPLFAIIMDLLRNEDCESFIKLFFCCRNSEEILLRNELYELKTYWNFNYTIYLSNCRNISRKYNENLEEHKLGFNDLNKYFWAVTGEIVNTFICGSEGFSETMKGFVKNCGVKDEEIYIF